MTSGQRNEIQLILDSAVFIEQRNLVVEAQEANGGMELRGLRVCQEASGTYAIYQFGEPGRAPNQLDRTGYPVDPSKGRHVFDWHGHTLPSRAKSVPSQGDLYHSLVRTKGTPGVIYYRVRGLFGRSKIKDRMFIGACRRESDCQ